MQVLFLVFIILVYFFVLLKKNPAYMFFSLIIFAVAAYTYYQQYIDKTQYDDHILKFIKNIEKETSNELELYSQDYHIHKMPKMLEYLSFNKDFMNILWDIKFVYIYDRHALIRLACYFEIFLKMHHNMLIGKYEYILYYPKLYDLHREIGNHIKSFTFNLPDISGVLDIENIDDYMNKKYKHINAMTYKYLKVIYNKYNKKSNTYIYKGPAPLDLQQSDRYSLL